MRQPAILAALCCATLTCGGSQPPAPDDHDAGLIDHDAGNPGDAGDSQDAGDSLDAGDSRDAGSSLDAGDSQDAGSSLDAGDSQDAGNSFDAGNSLDAGNSSDAGEADGGAAISCSWSGAPGVCISVTACAAINDHTSEPHECPGPVDIQCCIDTPQVADNPPLPAGYKLMTQAQVTSEMTTWAVAILHDSVGYPMFSTAMKSFGALNVLARVEWHPPDFQNGVVHRGVTLYVPA